MIAMKTRRRCPEALIASIVGSWINFQANQQNSTENSLFGSSDNHRPVINEQANHGTCAKTERELQLGQQFTWLVHPFFFFFLLLRPVHAPDTGFSRYVRQLESTHLNTRATRYYRRARGGPLCNWRGQCCAPHSLIGRTSQTFFSIVLL